MLSDTCFRERIRYIRRNDGCHRLYSAAFSGLDSSMWSIYRRGSLTRGPDLEIENVLV